MRQQGRGVKIKSGPCHFLPSARSARARQDDGGGQAVFLVWAEGSTCPPNFWRMAERIFSANVCSWRERKRVYKAEERTSAGTASSMAAWMVQRPSPESCTNPVYSERVGFSASAMAVRSSSQELTTLPRRQTSAMSARLRS